ncbi:baculoviral IAP repeat-containing protein 2-like [Planococcus citri]|uniref:baculoviral IAP repeat-containing protein 2-like n=1 Tax=Planococcus citri TaxID=170843 RepID=UPI0031F78BA0
MNYERSRLRTFENWPANAPVDGECIAKAGFYYMGQNLEVQCFSCGGRISEWQHGDKVMAKHRLLDPRCPFVVNSSDSGNVPISDGNDTAQGTSNGTVEDGSRYKNEEARLQSFMAWPIPSGIDGHRLAKAGFYWLQELRKVRCAFCGLDNPHWDSSVDPIIEHRRHSPNCSFLNNLSVGCSSHNSNDVIVLRENYLESERELDANQMKDFGILNHRIPKHSKYMTEESRVASFETWPVSEIKAPIDLAKAGFYYTGVEDKVRCYHCGGGLQKWKITDDPWIEHAKWFSTCDYIYLVKGKEFVDEVKQTLAAKKEALDEDGNSANTRQSTSQQANRNISLQNIDDNTMQILMSSPPVLAVLELGLDMSRIKQVVRDRLERHRTPFGNVDELLAAVLDAQFNEPVADLTEESWISDPIASVSDFNRLPVFENNFAEQGSSRYIHQLIERSLQNAHNNAESLIDESVINYANNSIETDTVLATDEERASSNSETEDSDINMDSMENPASNFDPPSEPAVDPQTLEEENRLLKQAKLCKICMDRDVNIVFLPCGHLISCSACAANLPDCPVCRQIIKGTVRTFLA